MTNIGDSNSSSCRSSNRNNNNNNNAMSNIGTCCYNNEICARSTKADELQRYEPIIMK